MKRRIREILETKGRQAYTINKDKNIYDAVTMLTEKRVGSLFVIDDREQVVGIITERDVLRVVFSHCDDLKNQHVLDYMTPDLYVASPDDTLDYAMSVMTEKKFRHLPVVEDNRLVGIVSIGDLVNELRSDDEFEIRQLHNFIAGNYMG